VPLFTGGEIAADVSAAKATQVRRHAEYRDLEARVQYDVRSAFLDLQGAERSVSVAGQNLDLAKEGLKEARDRFDVGLSNALEVIEAQRAIAEAEDNYISSIYAHNLAKLMLIRSTGTAEKDLQSYVGGN
jgi:outer membrane protein TolC